jgi:beta-1,4-mannosyltransferase
MLQALLSLTVLLSTILTIVLLNLPSQYSGDRKSQVPVSTGSASSSPEAHSSNRDGDDGDDGGDDDDDLVSVQILVLGDIGRSPRMQYHAGSIAKHGGQVQLIGYLGTFRRSIDIIFQSRI